MQVLDHVSSLAAITTSILSNNPEILLQSTLVSKSNIQNYYSLYSKNQEREADLYAIQRLNDLEISTKGLIEFLQYLEKESFKKGLSKESFMFGTHPSYTDRLNIISSFSNKNYKKLDSNLFKKFFFVKAKLFGHTENEIKILDTYLNGDSLLYSNAIILAKQGSLLEALKKINELIDKQPNNTFFLETKADILYNHGYTLEAKKFYEITLYKNSKNIHVKNRLFHIIYDKLEYLNYNEVNKFFERFNNLIFNNSKDINFYHKWLHIFQILEKEDWILFVNAWINILNKDKKKAIKALKEIKKISSNSKLVYNANKLINKISDA